MINTWLDEYLAEDQSLFVQSLVKLLMKLLIVPIADLDFLTVLVAILVFLPIGHSFDLKSIQDKEVCPRGIRQLFSEQGKPIFYRSSVVIVASSLCVGERPSPRSRLLGKICMDILARVDRPLVRMSRIFFCIYARVLFRWMIHPGIKQDQNSL